VSDRPDQEHLTPERSDAELLRSSASGDAAAFEAFVTRHERWLLRYARTLAGADGEEVMQDAFVAAWRGAKTFAGDGSAKAWLATIARNGWRRRFRHHVGEPAVHDSLDDVARYAVAAGWGADGPDVEYENLAMREALERALIRLSADEREVIVLRDLEGLTGEEAAATIGISLATLKSRLHRARLRLAAEFEEGRCD